MGDSPQRVHNLVLAPDRALAPRRAVRFAS